MEILLFLAAWYLSGVGSFIWWWTKDYNFGPTEAFMSIFIGLVGPIAFFLGWVIHGDKPTTVLIKRRH